MGTMNLQIVGAAVLIAAGLISSNALAEDTATPGRMTTNTQPASDLVTGSTIDIIVAAIELDELEVEITKDDNGNPKIESTDDSEPFRVYFSGCKEGKDCTSLEFRIGWDMENGVAATVVESWNSDKAWGVAYRSDNRDPFLSMSVNLKGGVTKENFEETVALWHDAVHEFEDHIGWDED